MTDPNAWLADAKCRGMDVDLFFTTRGTLYPDEALEACAACPVRAACLADALAYPDHTDLGLRAGLTERERRRLRRTMRKAVRCRHCGGEFERGKTTAAYCSGVCRRAAATRRQPTTRGARKSA